MAIAAADAVSPGHSRFLGDAGLATALAAAATDPGRYENARQGVDMLSFAALGAALAGWQPTLTAITSILSLVYLVLRIGREPALRVALCLARRLGRRRGA